MNSLQFIFHLPFVISHLPFSASGPMFVQATCAENEKWQMRNDKWKMLGRPVWLVAFVIAAILLIFTLANGQTATVPPPDPNARIIEGVNNGTVFGMGQSIRITGTVKEGAIAFGGDVIVEGTVEGDVASIGGSVVQRTGSRIRGDVLGIGRG